jgi:hypothetical protein
MVISPNSDPGPRCARTSFFPLWAETGDLDRPLFAEEEALGW